MLIGPKARKQLNDLGQSWKQGQHIFISGSTGMGKTELAHEVVEQRAQRGGHVIVFAMKPLQDPTLVNSYRNYTRWKTWQKNPPSWQNRILLWPDVRKANGVAKHILEIQREVYEKAFAGINHKGRYTVQIDEGLYTCFPSFLNMASDLAMSHAIGRSGRLTLVTLAQRPAHLPLILYGSASNAFIGRTREAADVKRLAELGPREGSKALAQRVADQGFHDFSWVRVADDLPTETVNLAV
jgi:hypothetical protein